MAPFWRFKHSFGTTRTPVRLEIVFIGKVQGSALAEASQYAAPSPLSASAIVRRRDGETGRRTLVQVAFMDATLSVHGVAWKAACHGPHRNISSARSSGVSGS